MPIHLTLNSGLFVSPNSELLDRLLLRRQCSGAWFVLAKLPPRTLVREGLTIGVGFSRCRTRHGSLNNALGLVSGTTSVSDFFARLSAT